MLTTFLGPSRIKVFLCKLYGLIKPVRRRLAALDRRIFIRVALARNFDDHGINNLSASGDKPMRTKTASKSCKLHLGKRDLVHSLLEQPDDLGIGRAIAHMHA